MKKSIEFEDINLNGPGNLEKKFTRDIRNYREFYLDHMVDQFFRHGRANGRFYIDFDKIKADDLWGYVGGELGHEIGKTLRERSNIYGSGCCIAPFGNSLSIAALKLSQNPKVKLDIKIDSERIKEKEIEEFFNNFSSESKIDIFLISYPLQLMIPSNLSETRNKEVYHIGSTDREHHILECGFKALANAFHYLKSKKSTPLVFKSTFGRERIGYKERNTHETQINLNLNLDGSGEHNLNFTCHLPSNILNSFRKLHSYMIKASEFNVNGNCVGNDEHHLIEDFGIIEGEVIVKNLEKRKTIRGIMRYGYDVQICNNCGKSAIAATDIIRRFSYTANLYPSPRRESELFSHYFEMLFLNSGIDGYLDVNYLDTLKGVFNEEIHETLKSVFDRNSIYQVASNLIKGNYDIQTKCDDKYHQNELLFAALGRALKQATRIDRSRENLLPTTKGLI